MNLEAASNQHRNTILSAGALIGFAMITGVGASEEQGPIVVGVVWILAIFHGISVFRMIRVVEPGQMALAIFSIFSVALFFIPTCIAVIAANKIFKQHGWQVNFYGGAQNPYGS